MLSFDNFLNYFNFDLNTNMRFLAYNKLYTNFSGLVVSRCYSFGAESKDK